MYINIKKTKIQLENNMELIQGDDLTKQPPSSMYIIFPDYYIQICSI